MGYRYLVPVFDEMRSPRSSPSPYEQWDTWAERAGLDHMRERTRRSEELFRRIGITFNVYGDAEGAERLIPFDVVPRVFDEREWDHLAAGLEQRVRALNLFLADVYHEQRCVADGIIPAELVAHHDAHVSAMNHFGVPGGVYTHVAGIDIVRTGPDDFFVLEDNARTPSGVSYMVENRETMLQLFPELFSQVSVHRVNEYPLDLLQTLSECAPAQCEGSPTVAVLTPGIYNSAHFEHAFLAEEMGVELVEGQDLAIIDGRLKMRSVDGYETVDVLYRRIDDAFLDPEVFRPESTLGVPGLMQAYADGAVTIANAPGCGICDDKAVYSFVPDLIRFYLDQDPIIANVETFRCSEPAQLDHVLANIKNLVVKEVDGSGGYGMLIGPAASRSEIETFSAKLRANPNGYIAQPTLALSTVPVLSDSGLVPRHVDLRPFVLCGPDEVRITPGGLTRVALREGSLIVNSSQGGGTKDTWVLRNGNS